MASSMWVAIGMIAVAAIMGNTIVSIIKLKGSSPGGNFKLRNEGLEQQFYDLATDLQDARQRIEVLEKIVTNQKFDLAREIDDLPAN